MLIFVLNAGSSSLKFRVFDMSDKSVIAEGGCERIGIDGKLKYKNSKGLKYDERYPMPTHDEAFRRVTELLMTGDTAVIKSFDEIAAVGHRVVHGGYKLVKSELVTEEVIKEIERFTDFAPLHTPSQVRTIRACVNLFGPEKPQVAVFDTAFHQTMPPKAYIYGIPYEYYKKYHIRRYGFHGISHDYVSEHTAELMGRDITSIKMVVCHLGNGSTIAAIDGGKSVDCSTGFGTFDGLMMGTRSGQVDPAALFYLSKREGLSVDDLNELLTKKSGLLGISGISSDDREVENALFNGNERAALARTIQCYQVRRFIGGYSFAMGGLDAIVFTAGLGENSPSLREEVLQGLEAFGIELDLKKNEKTIRGKEGDISTVNSKVKIYVVPTNEELKIASDTIMVAGSHGLL
ncbi:MAG: acetate kinase [Clostridiales bacterium]|nr:acetate kinase [Clostridiales bacterium]